MSDDDLTAIERAWCTGGVGTHWEGCHLDGNPRHHAGCAVARLVAEVRRVRAELDRVRWMTGSVTHRDDQAAECVGCGCVSATAEECVAELMHRHRAANLALAERVAACSAVLGRAAERGKVCGCHTGGTP